MTPINSIPFAQITEAFEDAMKDAPFDTVFHKLYEVIDVSWYATPADSRAMARRLFQTFKEIYEKEPGRMNVDEFNVGSGCLNIIMSTKFKNYISCQISFEPLICGYGSTRTH